MFKERLDKEVLEYYNRLYRNTWFLVKKKKLGEYRLINLVTPINIVIRRDIKLPLLVDKFVDKFARYYIISLVNLYSRYN